MAKNKVNNQTFEKVVYIPPLSVVRVAYSSTLMLLLTIILPGILFAQTIDRPVVVKLCEMVASPDEYNQKMLTVEGILLPGEHSVVLYSPLCKPKEGLDVGIEAIFPPEWVSSPNGKQLHKLFNHRKSASVKLIGTFESGAADRYGPDVARFRFTISKISSVKKVPPGIHP